MPWRGPFAMFAQLLFCFAVVETYPVLPKLAVDACFAIVDFAQWHCAFPLLLTTNNLLLRCSMTDEMNIWTWSTPILGFTLNITDLKSQIHVCNAPSNITSEYVIQKRCFYCLKIWRGAYWFEGAY